MEYVEMYPIKNEEIDTFVEDSNLFAVFDAPAIEVSSIYELKDVLKFTNKIISSGPAKTLDYLELSIDNDVIISVDDLQELKKYEKSINLQKSF